MAGTVQLFMTGWPASGKSAADVSLSVGIVVDRWHRDKKLLGEREGVTGEEKPHGVARLGKEEINALPLGRWDGPIHLVRTMAELAEAADRLAATSVLGFDTETRPAFKKGQKFSPSLVQLATGSEVFLFQLRQIGFAQPLRTILSNPAVIKAGVAPDFDLRSLRELEPFEPGGFVDLARMARRRGIRNHGLRGLAALVCGIRISKSARTSNWANAELTPQQIQYAATDAWIGWEIYRRLHDWPQNASPV
jgi:hypothetical protein